MAESWRTTYPATPSWYAWTPTARVPCAIVRTYADPAGRMRTCTDSSYARRDLSAGRAGRYFLPGGVVQDVIRPVRAMADCPVLGDDRVRGELAPGEPPGHLDGLS